MNVLNVLNKISSFEEVKKTFSNEPYNFQVKYNDEYYMLCHTDKSPDNVLTKECFGIIFDKNKVNKVVCYGFDKINKIKGDDDEFLKDFDSLEVQEAEDGSLIKVFWYNGKWNVSTKKCLDANKAYWTSSKSFFKMFEECCESMNFDYKKLDKTNCYMFVLKHPNNRIVFPYKKKSLTHVGTRNMETLREVDYKTELPLPKKYKFSSWKELVESFKNSTFLFQGYILKNKNNERRIIENDDFLKVKELKGNNPSVKFQYLNLRRKNQHHLFAKYYPEYKTYFNDVEENLSYLANKLYQTYVRVYIKKDTRWVVNEEFWGFLNKLHWIHKTQNRRITFNDVCDVINTCPFLKLAKTINAF